MTMKALYPALFLLAAGACSDTPGPTALGGTPVTPLSAHNSSERYVSIGTSITMGWQSNGVYEDGQRTSWAAALADRTGMSFDQPLIEAPGCTSPLVAPLGAFRRLSGESAAPSTVCAPNAAGVTLPEQNVGIAGAIAAHALLSRPEVVGGSIPWYRRVLPTGTTQLTAALSQAPTLISVELGGNEVLNGSSGLILDNVTVVPFTSFAAPYTAIMNAVQASGAKVLVVGMPADARKIPFLRPGGEIWDQRDVFAALNVRVDENCQDSPNWITTSNKTLGILAAAAASPTPVTYSCADVGGIDYVLTPADIANLNGRMAQIDGFIRAQATARGFAYVSLGVLFDDLHHIEKYDVLRQLTSDNPYGPFVSLDGVHPSKQGHRKLAKAAAEAIEATYPGTFTHVANDDGAVAALRAGSPTLGQYSISMAREAVAQLRGRKLPACPMPAECGLRK